MRKQTLSHLVCPACSSELSCSNTEEEITSGTVACKGCKKTYPILAGVLILVEDVHSYLLEHVKGISRYVDDQEIPSNFRKDFKAAKNEIEEEHIEEDLEAERITALYLMNHYLSAKEVTSSDPLINKLIKENWDHGPFSKIKNRLSQDSLSKHASMIELGCNVGGLYAALSKQLNSYLGLDFSFASIALARHFALGAPLKHARVFVPDDLLQGSVSREVKITVPSNQNALMNADFIVCDLAEPPVKTGKWDLCAALNVIDMLPNPDDLPTLQQKLLTSKGLAVQSCPYIWHPQNSANLREVLPKTITTSDKAVEYLYEKSGLKIQHTETHVPWLFFKNTRQLEIYSVHILWAQNAAH